MSIRGENRTAHRHDHRRTVDRSRRRVVASVAKNLDGVRAGTSRVTGTIETGEGITDTPQATDIGRCAEMVTGGASPTYRWTDTDNDPMISGLGVGVIVDVTAGASGDWTALWWGTYPLPAGMTDNSNYYISATAGTLVTTAAALDYPVAHTRAGMLIMGPPPGYGTQLHVCDEDGTAGLIWVPAGIVTP